MLRPEINESLCVGDDVVAVRFADDSVCQNSTMSDGISPGLAGSIAKLVDPSALRFLVLDLRNMSWAGHAFFGQVIRLFKLLGQQRCQLAILCTTDLEEMLQYLNLAKAFPAFCDEGPLRDYIANAADVPVMVMRQAAPRP
jgi:hypothetical protein